MIFLGRSGRQAAVLIAALRLPRCFAAWGPLLLVVFFLPATATADVDRRTLNNGNLIVENVPEIPIELVVDLMRFQNIRAAGFRAWTPDGDGIYVATGFGDVDSLHLVEMPGGARHQITFYREPVTGVTRRPGGAELLFTRDAGGSEFAQIFQLDPASGEATMLTDGKSRNTEVVWDRSGRRIAYQSTRRNGASNDVWIMDPTRPGEAELVLESPDGSWWGAVEFSASGSKLLLMNYVSATDSRVHVLDLDSGQTLLLAGGPGNTGTNMPVAFDDEAGGIWLVTNQGSEFSQLAWQPAVPGARPEIVTANIPWSLTEGTISHDRRRMAFVTNEDGMSRVYLLDTKSREYRLIESIPTGLAFGLRFSPDDRRLAVTLNTPQTPSDAFVLELGDEPLDYGPLVRWTRSEVGGLDTSQFRIPELVRYPTFDKVAGRPREIPAWVYKPAGEGPFPVIISIHGGPEGQARPSFSATYQMWIDKLGVAVVRPNVRGSRGYGKTYLGLDNGFKREDSVRDIGALLDWIATQPDLDADRVAVYGGSYGGYMVLASAAHFSDRLKAAVDIVGISNFVSFLENTQDYRRDLRRAEYGDERDPVMRAHLEKISPLNNVDKISVPLFIVQGQNDPRVPVTESEQMVNALREHGHTVWYMNAMNEGHGYRKRDNRDTYQQAMMLFFQAHLTGAE
ncbi:MAG: alpha/beta fold hydrolase [Gammaproteobacteria bacterium]|nr:alpha/beta fold hydrolase [Gammaproteobacteria bacterium]MDH3480401.1 alpha/beta fold hydrolase [Gammaproteobacteria bacterium]